MNARYLLPLAAAARLAGVARNTLDRAAVGHQLPYMETRLGRLFDPADVEAWAAARRGQA